MDCLKEAQQALQDQLSGLDSSQDQLVCVSTQITADFDLLAWLKGQSLYPQFYLNFRDGSKKIASIGKERSFSGKFLAQEFVNQHHFPLVGGIQFNGESQFILPELLLEQNGDQLRISFFTNKKNFQKSTALSALEQLAQLQPLPDSLQWQSSQKANQAEWCNWVEQALQRIQQGELSKIVLANETRLQLNQSINAKDFLHQSEQQNWGCYHFLWAETPDSQFVGSTPERLFARQGKQLFTEALAGTALLGQDEDHQQQHANWLLNDEKNLQENWLVVQDICHNLQQHLHDDVQQIQVDDVELKPLRNVQHLIRKIQAEISPNCQQADAQILNAIHPTAAVSGLPQQQAKQALSQIETFDRSWYAGTLGWLSQTESEFCVAIRSAFIEPQQIRLFAGAGIVADSQPQAEWLEIERKATGLISLLQNK